MAPRKKSNAGAPTKYRDEYCKEIIKFFDVKPYEVSSGDDGKVAMIPGTFPTLARFALSIGVHRDTIHEWGQKHPEFSDSIKMAKQYQEAFLIEAALVGAIDKTFAIFAAKNIIGWSDKGSSDYIHVNIRNCKTPLEKANRIINYASEGKIPLDKATSLINAISSTIKIDELTEMRKDLDELKKKLGNNE